MESGKPALYEKVIEGGWNWSHIVKRGTALRLTDLEGGANVSAIFFNAHNTSERYDMGDTLKIQHISSLALHWCIYSDMGRILMSITKDSCGWHDVICGVTYASHIRERFGEKTYQEHRNDFYRNGYDSMLVEMAKHGLGKVDFAEVVNFFSKVAVDPDGGLRYVEGFSKPGSVVELRAEMDTLVVLDAGMHPLNPAASYQRKPVLASIVACPPAGPDDPCRRKCPENERGFFNTELYHI
jgi:urea carboxylase-associated protein 2